MNLRAAAGAGRGRGATGASVPVLRLEPAGLGFLDMALQVPIKVEGAKTARVAGAARGRVAQPNLRVGEQSASWSKPALVFST